MSNKPSDTIADKIPAETTVTDFAKDRINSVLSGNQRIAFYRDMVRIRRFEERSLRAYQAKKIGGFLHLYVGQEAVAIGSCSVLQPEDHIITAYRDHGHALAIGMEMKPLMAELYGKAAGCSKGKGGSMHFFDPARHFWGGHGIVGGQVPLGIGIAYALKYQESKAACLTFMGDGAVNQGAVHESHNLAALWQLPVVFVIENNGYSMGTSQERSSAGQLQLSHRAESYGMDWGICDGHDLYQVRVFIDRHLRLAREQSRPSILEVRTYRYRGHSVSDPDTTYRRKSEIEEYRRLKDPIQVFQNQLAAEGVLDQGRVAQIDAEARAEAEAAADFAEASPFPEAAAITRDVYWEEDHPSEKKSQGRIFFD